MTESNAIRVNVSALQELPIQTKNISLKLVKIISNKAKSNPDEIHPISVGRVNNLLYPINDHETLLGLRKSDIQQVNAFIIDYPTMKDLIVAHVRKNLHPHGIDPLKIRQVIDYLATDGVTESETCKALWLDRRPELIESLRYEITDKTKNVLLEMAEEICNKMYFVTIPVYYVARISKISKAEQYDAALELKSFTMSKMSSDGRSSWPSTEAIQTVLGSFHKEKKVPPTKDRMAKYPEKGKSKGKSAQKSDDSKAVKKAEPYIGADPNLIYIPIKGKEPDMIIHKKTGRIRIAEEKAGTYSMTGDVGKPTYVLGDHVVKFLDIDNSDSIHVCKYDTFEKAQNALAKAQKSLDKTKNPQKCVILSSIKLPRS